MPHRANPLSATRGGDVANISDDGERVSHLFRNDCYYAHLSIYAFASRFAGGARVLDAGCGSGYGTHYLAGQGARAVCGVDVSKNAVAFSRDHFRRNNLAYRVGDLQRLEKLQLGRFDLVFSSNVAEHIPDAAAFLRGVWRVTAPGGVFLLAVPPITTPKARADNLANPYHLNIWSPRQWHGLLRSYFAQVQCHRHLPSPGKVVDFANNPAQTTVNEEDFLFPPASLDELSGLPSLTAVFVARGPLPAGRTPDPAAPMVWVDDSFTRPALPRASWSSAPWRRLSPRPVKRLLRLLWKRPA